MKITVRTFLISMLLILAYNISGKAIDFAKVCVKSAETCKVSVTLFLCSSTSSEKTKQENSKFADTRFSRTTDVELGTEPFTEIYSSNWQRMRRVIEDNIFLRNIFLILSNHENLLVHGRTRQHFSDGDLCYAVTGSDYHICTLRRVLIQPLTPF